MANGAAPRKPVPATRSKWLKRIGAVTAVIMALGLLVKESSGLLQGLKGVATQVGLAKPYCESVDVDVRAYDVVPYALNRTIKARHYRKQNDELLYWVLINAKNECYWDDVVINVTFKLVRGRQYARLRNKETTLSLPAGQRRTITDDPDLFFTNAQARIEGEIEIEWEVLPSGVENPSPLRTGRRPLVVLPRDVFAWDWRNTDGSPVQWRLKDGSWVPIPASFLVASLAAWTSDTHETVYRVIDKLNQTVALSAAGVQDDGLINKWIETAYTELFRTSRFGKMRLTASSVAFPTRRPIQLTSSLLAARGVHQVDPLESALMLAALGREILEKNDNRFGILLIPASAADPIRKSVYFLWWLRDGRVRALDMGEAGKRDFAANLQTATSTASKAFVAHPEVVASLDRSGVHYQDPGGIVAIEIRGAKRRFGIKRIQ